MIEEALWKILAFLLALVLIFIGPTITAYDRMDGITYNLVMNEVARFSDTVKDKGVVTRSAYNELRKKLSDTGVSYDITLEHYDKTYVPVYESGVFKERYEIAYDGFYEASIIKAVEDSGSNHQYKMSVGDLFYVQVENTSPTKSQTIRQLLLGVSQKYSVIVVRNGGMVRHEPN